MREGPKHEPHFDTTEARQGETRGIMRWVLLASITVAILAIIAAYIGAV